MPEILFETPKVYFDSKEDHPEPIKVNIPDWFKKLPHKREDQTVKGCMPFLDALTSGYLLRFPQDLYIEHNVTQTIDGKERKGSYIRWGLEPLEGVVQNSLLNMNTSSDSHHKLIQVRGSPFCEKNSNQPLVKVQNPWRIKTPPGYSCLFVPPMNNRDDRFEAVCGIVETDTYDNEINLPIVFNGDKYPTYTGTIEKGTPLVQIIPFKRESWKLKVKPIKDGKRVFTGMLNIGLRVVHNYKKRFWKKKTWN